MRMVKQRPITDGTIAIDCGVCPVAMLTDLPYEKVLADIPHYHATSHHDWMRYFNLLGFRESSKNAKQRLESLEGANVLASSGALPAELHDSFAD